MGAACPAITSGDFAWAEGERGGGKGKQVVCQADLISSVYLFIPFYPYTQSHSLIFVSTPSDPFFPPK